MKKRSIKTIHVAIAAATLVAVCQTAAWAAEGSGFTRESYDLLMRWVNFIIMAALIVKYARQPFMDFIRQKHNEIADLLKKYEQQKQEAQDKIREYQVLLAANQERIKLIRDTIIAEGRRLRDQTIADGRTERDMMLNMAQAKIEHYIREASLRLRHDLIDAATELALTKLPGILEADDHQRFFDQWLHAVDQPQPERGSLLHEKAN